MQTQTLTQHNMFYVCRPKHSRQVPGHLLVPAWERRLQPHRDQLQMSAPQLRQNIDRDPLVQGVGWVIAACRHGLQVFVHTPEDRSLGLRVRV
jgi:hypothetical protein